MNGSAFDVKGEVKFRMTQFYGTMAHFGSVLLDQGSFMFSINFNLNVVQLGHVQEGHRTI